MPTACITLRMPQRSRRVLSTLWARWVEMRRLVFSSPFKSAKPRTTKTQVGSFSRGCNSAVAEGGAELVHIGRADGHTAGGKGNGEDLAHLAGALDGHVEFVLILGGDGGHEVDALEDIVLDALVLVSPGDRDWVSGPGRRVPCR